jgi:hypothetical protein
LLAPALKTGLYSFEFTPLPLNDHYPHPKSYDSSMEPPLE